jgi:hypothetical protein
MMAKVAALALVLTALHQNQAAGQIARLPVLKFPEPGLDDTAAYQGYQTRFYRDSRQNTVQIYLDPRSGRAVTVLANAANESIGFTARDSAGHPARLSWGAVEATVTDSGATRTIEYHLQAQASQIELGWFVLGSMRIERDLQYSRRHLRPFDDPPFRIAEESLLVADVARLPAGERARHLEILGAASLAELRQRLLPGITPPAPGKSRPGAVFVSRPSLDNQNAIGMRLRVDPRSATIEATHRTVTVRSRSQSPVRFAVQVMTDAAPLTPLRRNEIFNQPFLTFLAGEMPRGNSAGRAHYRRLERQVRAVELLSSKEKLMAGLPNYGTYFGRDMMMSALMMQPVWTPAMSEHVIASVLRKLGPSGEVSHEEALGGQAIRENAVVYDSVLTLYFRAARAGRHQSADSLLEQSRGILRNLQKTRENYHMIDDEFQLPVLVARYLADSAVTPERKRAFLFDSSEGRGSRIALLLREMTLVAGWTHPYVEDSRPLKLVSFPRRGPGRWRSASWRDSEAGYAGGRFAMDVNAIWAPQALESFALILASLKSAGMSRPGLDSLAPGSGSTPLGEYYDDPATLRRAVDAWRGARRHFEVALGPKEVQRKVQAKLARLPQAERRYWRKVVAELGPSRDSVFFLALSLDATGRPIPVVNTDPATGLFLEDVATSSDAESEAAPWDVGTFVLPYPLGLFVDSLGPLVANDAYASREVWERFRADTYHSPRVVWGREVNLLLLGLARRIGEGSDSLAQHVLRRTTAAVAASGLGHNELWGYRIAGGRLLPVRHAGLEMSTDIQLWNTTDLAVEFVLSQLARAEGPQNMPGPSERELGWRSLFDGRTTAGWRGYRKKEMPSGWEVIDGALTRVAPGGDIVTIDQYGDFELSLEWRVSRGGNSGIFYRVSEDLEHPWQSGPEMQVLDDAAHADGRSPLTSAGALYGIYPAKPGVVRPAGEWNAVRLVVKGQQVEHWLNGEKVVDAEIGSPDWEARVKQSKFGAMPRYGRNRSGHIGLQDHGDRVSYRNIRIRPL